MRPTVLRGAWSALALAHGGVPGLARVLGVSPRTVLRWATGVSIPRGPEQVAIGAAAKSKGVRSPVDGGT
jgi:hypothetical protein